MPAFWQVLTCSASSKQFSKLQIEGKNSMQLHVKTRIGSAIINGRNAPLQNPVQSIGFIQTDQ